nr:MAG TPA: hypothetical protein [Caudoviricetes sp.]
MKSHLWMLCHQICQFKYDSFIIHQSLCHD